MNIDFTLGKYRELCEALQESYTTCTVNEYLTTHRSSDQNHLEDSNCNVAILRHDVDRKIGNALRMAQLEHHLGVQASYYFRYPYTFNPEIITIIQSLGHEVGYHYETLSKARGNVRQALALFKEELAAFRSICEVNTICMHGSPLSRYDNRDLWKHADLKEFGLLGEAYLSIDGHRLSYFTDTGRNWNGTNSVRDMLPGAECNAHAETTDDLIGLLRGREVDCLYLTVHPERWAVSEREWALGYMTDLVVNAGKTFLVAMR